MGGGRGTEREREVERDRQSREKKINALCIPKGWLNLPFKKAQTQTTPLEHGKETADLFVFVARLFTVYTQ